MNQTTSFSQNFLNMPLIQPNPSTTPLFKMALFFFLSCPSMPVGLFSFNKEADGSFKEGLFQSGKSLLEAAFIISLLVLRLHQEETRVHYPLSIDVSKQLKWQIRDALIAGMVVCNVAPSIANLLINKDKTQKVNKVNYLFMQNIISFLTCFYSVCLLEI